MSSSLENALIKKPYVSSAFNEEELAEFIKCADPIIGPGYFIRNYFYIQHPVRGKLLYKPYDYQTELLDVYHKYRFSINLLGRQMGKTTTAAGYLLWYAMFNPDSTILIAAHKYTGSQEIMQRIRYAYESCPDFIRAGVTSYNKGSIEFENGSRLVSATTTETTGRGMALSLLYSDEFAFVRNTIAKEFWTSISPTLATGGKAIITSTPNSDEDQFWQIWKSANRTIDEYGNSKELGENGFKAYMAKWDRHPDRDKNWADQERASIGIERFSREHDCQPIIFDETLVSAVVLSQLTADTVVEKQGQVRWFKKPNKNSTYVISLDPSLGTGGDYSAIQVFELPSCRQVAEWQHNKTPIQGQIRMLKEICDYLSEFNVNSNNVYYSVENNTLGEAALITISDIGEENIKGVFLSEPAKIGQARKYRKGFNTTNKNKLAACAKFKQMIESGKLTVSSSNLISELKTFVSSAGSFAAKTGETDDLVMATLLAVRMIQVIQNFDASLDKHLRSDQNELLLPMPFIMS
jgi:hypothetical protein